MNPRYLVSVLRHSRGAIGRDVSLVRTVLWGPWAMGPCGSWDLCVWDRHFLPQQRTLAVMSGTASPPPRISGWVGIGKKGARWAQRAW